MQRTLGARLFLALTLAAVTVSLPVFAVVKDVAGSQGDYEHSVESVVRNKKFYRAGKLELGGSFGIAPYDLAFNYMTFGGRLTWHIADHYGWEIVDFTAVTGGVTTFVTSLAGDSTKQIQNLQMAQLKQVVSSNFLLSPLYGKIRMFGAQVVFFDLYLPFGIGMAKTQTLQFSNSDSAGSVVGSGSDLTLTTGVGFKIYVNNLMGIVIDLRNYMTNSQVYGSKSFKSNFMASFGLTFFLPTF